MRERERERRAHELGSQCGRTLNRDAIEMVWINVIEMEIETAIEIEIEIEAEIDCRCCRLSFQFLRINLSFEYSFVRSIYVDFE